MAKVVLNMRLGLHPDQVLVHSSPARFKVVVAGRRWGKSRLGARYLLEGALEGEPTAWVFPTYPMGTPQWRLLKRLVAPIPGVRKYETDRTLELPGGGLIVFKSGDREDSIRGDGYKRVVVDEFAFLRESVWPHEIRPALSDLVGSALIISSPKGKGNHLYTMAERAKVLPGWATWTFPTSSNPFIQPDELEEARLTLPARVFDQEYLALFLDVGAGLFGAVMEAATAKYQAGRALVLDDQGNPLPELDEWQRVVLGPDGKPLPRDAKHEYVAGLDLARHTDYTVLTVLDITDHPYQACHIDRFNRMTWNKQVERVKDTITKFGIERLLVDATGMGDPVTERLRDELADVCAVDGFVFTGISKAPLLEDLALAIEQGELTFLPDQDLVTELQSLETKTGPTGRAKYEARSGRHDDTVMSLALAYRCASTGLSLGIL